ncbi:MAG: N-acetyltransferase [Pseudomonadales bacterium]
MYKAQGYQIVPVQTRKELTDFIRAPSQLYRNDPNYITPLMFERRQALSPKNPYFAHAQWQAFVAYASGKPIARISAQIDALQQHEQCATGCFGMFEAPDDPELVSALFQHAHEWLRSRGIEQVAGPFSLSINQELGLLVEGFDTPPFFMMPHGLPYYERLVLAQGYQPTEDLLAMVLDPAHPNPSVMRRLISRYAERIHIRPVNRKRLTEELEVLCEIFNDAWQDNWGFVPFTREEFQAMGRELVMVVPKQLAQVAEVDGVPVAFCVMVPNLNEIIADLQGRLLPFGWLKLLWRLKVRFPSTSRAPLMGVRKQFQDTPLGPALAFTVMDVVRRRSAERGIKQLEMSWILESNHAMRKMGEVMGAKVSKRYRMYSRAL